MSVQAGTRSEAVSVSSKKPAGRRQKPLPTPLRELRGQHGKTLSQAAELAGLNPARLSELERGIRWPKRAELEALEWIYGVSLRVGFVIVVDEDGA